jgi:hypothetical protein
VRVELKGGELAVREIGLEQIHVEVAKLGHELTAIAGGHWELVVNIPRQYKRLEFSMAAADCLQDSRALCAYAEAGVGRGLHVAAGEYLPFLG